MQTITFKNHRFIFSKSLPARERGLKPVDGELKGGPTRVLWTLGTLPNFRGWLFEFLGINSCEFRDEVEVRIDGQNNSLPKIVM